VFIFVQERPAGHLQAKLREIDIPVKREWLTMELTCAARRQDGFAKNEVAGKTTLIKAQLAASG
jgi:hypothetical protein